MTTPKTFYERWINELWAGKGVAAELVSGDFVGHWPHREVHGPVELEEIIAETRNMLADLTFEIEVGRPTSPAAIAAVSQGLLAVGVTPGNA